jgi:hypothetical protein
MPRFLGAQQEESRGTAVSSKRRRSPTSSPFGNPSYSMPLAMLPIYGGFEAPARRWWLVRAAGRIAERARHAGAPATAVTHGLVGVLLANPTLVMAQLAIGLSHRPQPAPGRTRRNARGCSAPVCWGTRRLGRAAC